MKYRRKPLLVPIIVNLTSKQYEPTCSPLVVVHSILISAYHTQEINATLCISWPFYWPRNIWPLTLFLDKIFTDLSPYLTNNDIFDKLSLIRIIWCITYPFRSTSTTSIYIEKNTFCPWLYIHIALYFRGKSDELLSNDFWQKPYTILSANFFLFNFLENIMICILC